MRDDPRRALDDSDRRRLVRAASRLLGPADAEDAVQDAYVRALAADGPGFDATPAWLFTVVRNGAIDRLRRRGWLQRWLTTPTVDDRLPASPSAETEAARAEEVVDALRLLAARLTPADGAAVLLHAVFEASHAEIARGSGGSEAAQRQRLRRALSKLRQAAAAPVRRASPDPAPDEAAVFALYLQSLQWRDPEGLWAVLRRSSTLAAAATGMSATGMLATGTPAAGMPTAGPPATACRLVSSGGRLGMVLALDGVALCVVPLGVRPVAEPATAGA